MSFQVLEVHAATGGDSYILEMLFVLSESHGWLMHDEHLLVLHLLVTVCLDLCLDEVSDVSLGSVVMVLVVVHDGRRHAGWHGEFKRYGVISWHQG